MTQVDPSAAPAEPVAPEGGEGAEEIQTPEEGWKDYATKMRHENAERRQYAQGLEEILNDPQIAPLTSAAKAIMEGRHGEVTNWLIQNAAATLGIEPDVLVALAEEGDEEPEDDAPQGMSPEQMDAWLPEQMDAWLEEKLEERLSGFQQETQVQAIYEKAEEMGYEVGSRDYMNLLHLAVNETDGDLDKAEEMLKAERQKIIDEYLDSKRQAAQGSPRTTSGAAPSSERKVSLDQAADAALEWLDAQG